MKNPNSSTEEFHIFEMKLESNGKYNFYPNTDPEKRCYCICKALHWKDAETEFILKNIGLKFNNPCGEIKIREICAKIGRQVCGTCISSLYGNFPLE